MFSSVVCLVFFSSVCFLFGKLKCIFFEAVAGCVESDAFMMLLRSMTSTRSSLLGVNMVSMFSKSLQNRNGAVVPSGMLAVNSIGCGALRADGCLGRLCGFRRLTTGCVCCGFSLSRLSIFCTISTWKSRSSGRGFRFGRGRFLLGGRHGVSKASSTVSFFLSFLNRPIFNPILKGLSEQCFIWWK